MKQSPLEKAAREFAKAWCEWHGHSDLMLDESLIDAGHGIVKALGLMMNENPETGKYKLVRK